MLNNLCKHTVGIYIFSIKISPYYFHYWGLKWEKFSSYLLCISVWLESYIPVAVVCKLTTYDLGTIFIFEQSFHFLKKKTLVNSKKYINNEFFFSSCLFVLFIYLLTVYAFCPFFYWEMMFWNKNMYSYSTNFTYELAIGPYFIISKTEAFHS